MGVEVAVVAGQILRLEGPTPRRVRIAADRRPAADRLGRGMGIVARVGTQEGDGIDAVELVKIVDVVAYETELANVARTGDRLEAERLVLIAVLVAMAAAEDVDPVALVLGGAGSDARLVTAAHRGRRGLSRVQAAIGSLRTRAELAKRIR